MRVLLDDDPGRRLRLHALRFGDLLLLLEQVPESLRPRHPSLSLDQIAAPQLGRDTQLTSLELCLDSNELIGACEAGYSCAYANTLSWRNPTTPLPMENQPRAVFERLFGGSDNTSRAARLARIRDDRSILDSLVDEVRRLQRRLGPGDRARLTQYLDTVREVERRIRRADANARDNRLPDLERPVGVPTSYADHARLMFDLQVLAFQADITRVITFQLARELSNRTYPEIGVPDPPHPTSHHGNDPEKLAKIAKINAFHVSQVAYLLDRLNEQLRPKLLRDLKPGTRIVSHAFRMGDWEPEQSADVNGRKVYMWTVPAKRAAAR